MPTTKEIATDLRKIADVLDALPDLVISPKSALEQAYTAWNQADAEWVREKAVLERADAARNQAWAAVRQADAAQGRDLNEPHP